MRPLPPAHDRAQDAWCRATPHSGRSPRPDPLCAVHAQPRHRDARSGAAGGALAGQRPRDQQRHRTLHPPVPRRRPGVSTPATRLGSRRWNRALNASAILGAAATLATVLAAATPANATAGHFQVPAGATQLLVISSPTRVPADHLATFRAYERATARSAWRLVIGPWSAEIGYSGLRDRRREGDGSTPTG